MLATCIFREVDPKCTAMKPTNFEVTELFAIYRPQGNWSLEKTIEQCSKAIAYARDNGIHRLMINTSDLSAFEPRSIFDRFQMNVRWAEESRSRVTIALVTRPDLQDIDGFGATVALNRGMMINVVTSELQAMECLLQEYTR